MKNLALILCLSGNKTTVNTHRTPRRHHKEGDEIYSDQHDKVAPILKGGKFEKITSDMGSARHCVFTGMVIMAHVGTHWTKKHDDHGRCRLVPMCTHGIV